MKNTVEVHEGNFETEVMQAPGPVLVDFWAEWCGPCKMIAPVLDEIGAERAGQVKVVKVNVDTNPVLAARYGIRSIPTLLYFQGGEARRRTVGAVSKKAILAALDELAVSA